MLSNLCCFFFFLVNQASKKKKCARTVIWKVCLDYLYVCFSFCMQVKRICFYEHQYKILIIIQTLKFNNCTKKIFYPPPPNLKHPRSKLMVTIKQQFNIDKTRRAERKPIPRRFDFKKGRSSVLSVIMLFFFLILFSRAFSFFFFWIDKHETEWIKFSYGLNILSFALWHEQSPPNVMHRVVHTLWFH